MNGTMRYTIRPYDTIWMLAQVFNTTVDSIVELNPGIDPRKLMIGQVITLRPGFQRYPFYPENEEDNEVDMDGMDYEELVNYFRMLWEQHVVWTRMVIMGIVHDLPETEQMTNRLLRNPVDFANAFRPYFGDEAAQQFQDLFTKHITIASELVRAAKSGNAQAVTEADQRWRQNADQIAELMARMNPNWREDDWSAMLLEHLELLGRNAEEMLAGNWEQSVNEFDEIELQAMEMADMMAEGIEALQSQ